MPYLLEWLLGAGALALWMVLEWWAVSQFYRRRLLTLQARRRLDMQTAARLLAQSKQQVAQLQQEVALLRPQAVRAAQGVAGPVARRTAANESLSKMLEAPQPPRPRPTADAFADTLPSLQFTSETF
jgi:hypothetical protein